MTKKNSFILLLLLSIAAQIISLVPVINAADFDPHSTGLPFSVGNGLISVYNQIGNDLSGGYHQVRVYYNTTKPSINPDQTDAVKNIQCDNNAKTITLTLADSASLQSVKNWPESVIMMISHKWECFGNRTTQYHFVGNQTINEQSRSVTFTTQPCDLNSWSTNFTFDLQWINGKPPAKRSSSYKKRSSSYYEDDNKNYNNGGKRRRRRHDGRRKGKGMSDKRGSIDKDLKLNLDILFDENTGKSTKPNFPILSVGQGNNVTSESLVCANCFVQGNATLFMHVSGTPFPPKIEEARFGFNGSLRLNVDLAFNGQITGTITSPDLDIFEVSLTPLGIPNLFNLGPAFILAANSQISANLKGTLFTGGELSMPNFSALLNLDDIKNPQLNKTGFDVQSMPHDSKLGVTVGAEVAGSLKPQIGFDIDVLNGLFGFKTGVQVVTTLSANVDVGATSGCKDVKTAHLATVFKSNLGFFVQSKNLPVLPLPSKTLAETCLPF